MGTTCSNLHVFVGDQQLGPWLTSACGKVGFVPSPPEDADLTLVVAAAENWLTIQIEGQSGFLSETELRLADAISAEARFPVLITALYDSDEFAFVLFENGKQIDGFSTSAGLVPAKIRPTSAKKRPSLWSRVFARGISSEQIEKVFAVTAAYADVHLDRLCDVVQLPIPYSRFRYADRDPAINVVRVETFRRQQEELTVRQVGGVGDYDKQTSRRDVYVGESTSVLFEISARVTSLADPVLEINGSALDSELLDIPRITGLWHCGLQHVARRVVRQFEAQVARAEGSLLATVDDLSASALRDAPMPTLTILYSVWLQAMREGRGELKCTLRPERSLPDEIELKPRFQFHIHTPTWVPLRSEIGDALRQLNDPRFLLAVVIVPSCTSLDGIAPKIEHWLRHAAGGVARRILTAFEGQMEGENFRVPRRNKKLKWGDIGTKKWQQLFEHQASLQSLFIRIMDADSEEEIAGASVQRPCQDVDTGVETFHIGFWRQVGESHESYDILTHLVDEMFSEFKGIQAWLSTWNWIPRFTVAEENHYTPYEDSKGIGNPTAEHRLGQGFMQEEWCVQYLRGFGERLWLGPELSKRIDRNAIESLANITTAAPGIRLELKTNVPLADLEAALEVITPPPNPLS